MLPILFSFLASSAAVVSAHDSLRSQGCIKGNFHDLVIRDSCGDDMSIAKCLAEDVDLRHLDQIEQCFIAGGCDAIDSTVSAVWFSYECNDRQGSVEEAMKEDLRKRATESSSTSESTTESITTASSSTLSSASTTAATTTIYASTSASASTSSSTSAASSTTTTSSSTTRSASASTTTSITSSTSGTTTSATSSGTGTSTSSLACSTTSYYSTSVCSYGTGTSTGVTLGCVTTSLASSTCAPGVLCTTAASGDDVCMKIDNDLTTSGLAVTIFFAVSISAFLIGLLIIGCKDRRDAKKLQAERVALLEAKSKEAMQPRNQKRSKSVAQPDAFGHSEADLPLILEPSYQ
ncbi:dfb1de92-0099-4982-b6cd-f4417d7d8b0a-CDS [Sclerotinia trifoliorum]|uniref:Dfb1de92-0099-4982-b6cd-f4417d7d8b0a-CDS n=1 Tax=Sclerotinia trifoliorum TaxID=28548 RepID=A0A8H2ZQF1_9HELO|nr:dfb1de92-0099-4982-b6cd-f4417d7d8b0a-CDS [Sclerotinia trifoliorum]